MNKTPSNRETIIWLSSIGLSSMTIRNVMKNFSELSEIWKCDSSKINNMDYIQGKTKIKLLENRKRELLDKYIKRLEDSHISILTIYDENYPSKLRDIPDRPKILYIKGKDYIDSFSLAIVGSRRLTDYGRWATMKFANEIGAMGITIVSGMAAGIDSVAHREALETKTYTIGVLGCGIDVVYPKSNRELYSEVLENGTLISEFPLGEEPKPYNFPKRNRIISGLSDGVIVIEAKEKSGSLITAHHGLEQGKDIFAIPGNINSIFSSGTNKLIKDGAIPLLNIRDIINENIELQKRIVDKKDKEISKDDFSDLEIKIITLLNEPMHSDNIVYKTGIDISTINTILVGLELKEAIKEVGNNVFMRC